MRLSDIKGERVLDVIADIVEPVCNIAMDEEAAALFTPQPPKEGQTPYQAFIERIKESLPKLCREHKADVIAIFAAINGVDPKKYAKEMTFSSVLQDLYENATDEDFLAFLS